MQFYLVVTYYLTIFGSLRVSSLGGGGREGERGSTLKRACSQATKLSEDLFGGIGDAGGYHC